MRLTIKDGSKTNGANGASATRAAGAAATTATAIDGTKSPALATLLRTIDGTAEEIREVLLQLLSGVTPYVPRIRVRETSEAIVVTGVVPHVDEDTVELTFAERALHIYGGKSVQRERTRRMYRSVHKVYRTFQRTIPIHCDVDRGKTVATLRDGVLRIHVPKKNPSVEQSKPVPHGSESVAVA